MLSRKAALVFAMLSVIMVGFQNCAKVTFDGAELRSLSESSMSENCDVWVNVQNLTTDDPQGTSQNVDFNFVSPAVPLLCSLYKSLWRFGDGASDPLNEPGLDQVLRKQHAYKNPGVYLSQVTLSYGPHWKTQKNFFKPITIYRNSQVCDLNADLFLTGPQLINRGQAATYRLIVPTQCQIEVLSVSFHADAYQCQQSGAVEGPSYRGAFGSLPCSGVSQFNLTAKVNTKSGAVDLAHPVRVADDTTICTPEELSRLMISGPNQILLGEQSQFSLAVPDCMRVQNFQASAISWSTESSDGGSGIGEVFKNQFPKTGWYKVHADIPATRYFSSHRMTTNVYIRSAPPTTTTVPPTTTTVPPTTTTVSPTTTTAPPTCMAPKV
ncbi:MAG: hypothetical protein ACK5P6_04335, partial [Pseudobdellovibrionaceae bacterium]